MFSFEAPATCRRRGRDGARRPTLRSAVTHLLAETPSHEGSPVEPTMFNPMSSHSDTRWKRALDSVLRLARIERSEPPDLSGEFEFLRQLCRSLVQDLPVAQRTPLELRIGRSHDRADLWNLRSHLFGAISLHHGEHVARERLQQLDAHWA